MYDTLMQLGLFTSKLIILFIFILSVLIALFALIAKNKEQLKGKLAVKKLNDKFDEMKEAILSETLPKKEFKKYLKEKKASEKNQSTRQNIYVMNFQGDIKASAVNEMSEEINAILNVATPQDEVVLRLESPGGMVHGYGLAAAQLMRFREHHIPLTITVDKVAASGGYMMACVGNKILSAPFAITGSIGVLIQMPNFNRFLKGKHIDFEQMTAGEYKRTISLFGENTKEGKAKLQETIEETHQLFKDFIIKNRPQVDIPTVATGEHWFGEDALKLKLVDELRTSDDYLLTKSSKANIYDIRFETTKPLLTRVFGAVSMAWHQLKSVLQH